MYLVGELLHLERRALGLRLHVDSRRARGSSAIVCTGHTRGCASTRAMYGAICSVVSPCASCVLRTLRHSARIDLSSACSGAGAAGSRCASVPVAVGPEERVVVQREGLGDARLGVRGFVGGGESGG